MKRSHCTAWLLTLTCCAFALTSNAQTKRLSYGAYVELGVPTGDFHKTNKVGRGTGLSAEMKLTSRFTATLSAGFERFTSQGYYVPDPGPDGKGIAVPYPVMNAIPIRFGIQYDLTKLFFVKMEVGTVSLFGNGHGTLSAFLPPDSHETGTYFLYAPSIGVHLGQFDISAKYEHWGGKKGTNFMDLKAAYHF